MIVVVVLLVAIAAFVAGCVFTASRGRLSRRGGYVDLSAGAARGDWAETAQRYAHDLDHYGV